MQYKLSDAVKSSGKGVLIDIHVISQSKKTTLDYNGWEPRVRIKVKSPPVKGKANEEVTAVFKKLFGSCEITSGFLSPKKTLLLKDCAQLEVIKKLEECLKKA
jgi:uncharacterized protein (TIGR00251 family)